MTQDLIAITIPGLCVGGHMSLLNEPGYLILFRGCKDKDQQESVEQRMCRWIWINVWFPLIEVVRQHVDPTWKPGQPIPDHLHAAWWGDGYIPNLKCITEWLMGMFLKLKITPNKSNPARTGVEQNLDVNPGFKNSKHWVDVGVYKGKLVIICLKYNTLN